MSVHRPLVCTPAEVIRESTREEDRKRTCWREAERVRGSGKYSRGEGEEKEGAEESVLFNLFSLLQSLDYTHAR